MPLFIDKIAAGEPITIYGPEKVLDFTYVDDCVSGIVAGIEKLVARDITGETINLANGEGRSLKELVSIISSTLGAEPCVTEKPTRPGEVTRYVANITKARGLLGYSPSTSLEEGVPKEIEWAQTFRTENPDKET